jgi:DNA-binding protein H-NS
MAKKSLTTMTSEALVKLRDQIGSILNRRAGALQRELRSLGQDYANVGRIALYGRKTSKTGGSKLAGRKVPAKYRGPQGETWSGRGAQPRWLVAEMEKGKTRESFLIEKNSGKRPGQKKAAKRKKRTARE